MSFITLSKSNFFHNLSLVEEKVKSKKKIAVVIKDNAYGHGIELIAKLSQEYGITKAIVRNVREANQVLDYFDDIISLSSSCDRVDNKISQTINTLEDIDKLAPHSKVELKIDTNMHRNGVMPDELLVALDKIQKNKLILNGVMTHFASADMLNNSVFLQQQIFANIKKQVLEFCKTHKIKPPLFHTCNSSATFRLEDMQDFVRVGICIYGYIYLDKSFNHPNLKPIMSLWANRISQRIVEPNETVGYGDTGFINKKSTISTYDIGYGDGFFRLTNKHKYHTADGHKVIGRVSMDSFCADCADEKICIFDDARALADAFDTITYDVVTKLNQNIERVICE